MSVDLSMDAVIRIEAIINALTRERDTIHRAMVSPVYRAKLVARYVAVCEDLSRAHMERDWLIRARKDAS